MQNRRTAQKMKFFVKDFFSNYAVLILVQIPDGLETRTSTMKLFIRKKDSIIDIRLGSKYA